MPQPEGPLSSTGCAAPSERAIARSAASARSARANSSSARCCALAAALQSTAPPRSLYVHLPFCRRRCFYCDFPVVVAGEASALTLALADNRWCAHVGRPHRSNGVYLVARAADRCFQQFCFDADCRRNGFRGSDELPLPAHLLGALDPRRLEPPPAAAILAGDAAPPKKRLHASTTFAATPATIMIAIVFMIVFMIIISIVFMIVIMIRRRIRSC